MMVTARVGRGNDDGENFGAMEALQAFVLSL
jgi:hypothetical protein